MSGQIDAGKLFERSGSAADPTSDYHTWQILKPYIGQCLTLNHEINNPLTALLGYIEILLLDSDKFSASELEYLEHVRQAAQKIKFVAQELSREKIELAEKVDLRPIIEAYAQLARDHSK